MKQSKQTGAGHRPPARGSGKATVPRKAAVKRDKKSCVAIGAAGEKAVSTLLSSLGPEYKVWERVEANYGDIDHIVLSQTAGLFLIETKAHSGTVSPSRTKLRDGSKLEEFIAQTVRNQRWLSEKVKSITDLDVWINCIIVFTNASVEQFPRKHCIVVTNVKYLLAEITKPMATQKREMVAKLWATRNQLSFRTAVAKLVDRSGAT